MGFLGRLLKKNHRGKTMASADAANTERNNNGGMTGNGETMANAESSGAFQASNAATTTATTTTTTINNDNISRNNSSMSRQKSNTNDNDDDNNSAPAYNLFVDMEAYLQGGDSGGDGTTSRHGIPVLFPTMSPLWNIAILVGIALLGALVVGGVVIGMISILDNANVEPKSIYFGATMITMFIIASLMIKANIDQEFSE